jgi:hypothetical protein
MRTLLTLIAAMGLLWAIDVAAFDGRYSRAVWQDVNYQGQQFNYEVQRWIKKAAF